MDENNEQLLPCYDKLTFDTKKQAQASATVVRYQHGTTVYPYRCRYCGLWHLSSRKADDD